MKILVNMMILILHPSIGYNYSLSTLIYKRILTRYINNTLSSLVHSFSCLLSRHVRMYLMFRHHLLITRSHVSYVVILDTLLRSSSLAHYSFVITLIISNDSFTSYYYTIKISTIRSSVLYTTSRVSYNHLFFDTLCISLRLYLIASSSI